MTCVTCTCAHAEEVQLFKRRPVTNSDGAVVNNGHTGYSGQDSCEP